MKKILLILLFITNWANAQIINIPDSNFKGMLLNASPSNSIATDMNNFTITIDTNGDGEIQLSEALQVYNLRIIQANIADLTGIEYFTSLLTLNCGFNQLTSLAGVTSLPNLTGLTCEYNQFTALDVSSIATLSQLRCNNNSITSLNFNDSLILLDSSHNPLGTLNVNALTNLEVLRCNANLLSNLDVTNQVNLNVLHCKSNSLSSLNVSTLVNLINLDFSANTINTIDLTALVDLEYLTCSQNGLTSLNVSSSPNLIELVAHDNEIPSLNVAALANLEKLQINDNQLTSIDLTGLNNLKYLSCHYNPLTTLTLTSQTNLEHLLYGNQELATIDVGNQVNLESLSAYELTQLPTNIENLQNLKSLVIIISEMEEIDVSYLSSLTSFSCFDSEQLTYVNVKNGNDFTTNGISFSNNPNLLFVCVNDNDLNNVYDLGEGNGDFHASSYCTFTPGGDYNTIKGSVLWNCDEDERTIYTKVTIYDGIVEGATFTDQNGEYTFFTQAGTQIILPVIENPSFFTLTPPINAVIFPDNNNNVETLDFCISPNGINPDLEVVIAPLLPARPGFNATYEIVYRNKGNTVLSQDYGLSFFYNQHLMTYVSATVNPDTQIEGTLNWSYENLLPFESRSIIVTMLINTPTDIENPVNIDDVLTFTSIITPQAGDENVVDNTFIFNQVVVGAYDPNDITCIEGDVVSPDYIGEELHYIIRFENTGNFYAENVVVVMDIDPTKYDVSSLKVLNSSHDMRAQVRGNKAEFIFSNIYLDSGGHGNILLVMNSKNSLTTGDFVKSKADIYFDYNYPIITNEAETLFEALSVVNPVLDNIISIYPNPTKDIVNISIKDNSTIKTIELYDIQGRLLQTQIVNNVTSELNLADRANGMYFIKINTDLGSKLEKLVKK
ncbi:T9SS type A sorting domain-containing protein [Flavobacterium azooxidireducens]|uniref:T9SS type A sorting domain-containing protein n=1 Tax=Flavobacterium azooxidireducens TaxID=1871076 RepID=A0ABY4KCC2_9FLAO|nr:T9SS type A sorting domain-containing protein [Flavobacterium azooxidireducens]UPQ77981.1 T9SS type A sorting domain-containing protein [Flavobacterium azooxidireducens]